MIGTKSLINYLRISFGRIRSRCSSKVRPIHKIIQMIETESLIDCLRTSFGRIKSRRSSKVRPIHEVIQMIETESLIDCLRTSFGRIRLRCSSKIGPIRRSFKWLGLSLWWTAYVPLLGGSGLDVVQDMGPIHKAIQMIETESLLDYLRTLFRRIKSRHSLGVWPIWRSCR